jgi:hypothetical protein
MALILLPIVLVIKYEGITSELVGDIWWVYTGGFTYVDREAVVFPEAI